MAKMVLYNFKDNKKQDISVSDDVFGIKINNDIIKQAVQYHLVNQQTGLAHTKTRGEVKGGGRKPWRQKGTGRARQGSTRSPIWVGGGITFGPRKRVVTQKFPKKMRRLAIRSVLSTRLQEGKLWAYEALELSQAKTKELSSLLKNIPAAKSLLIVSREKDDLLKLATRNLSSVDFLETAIPSVLDLLNSDFILLHKDMIKLIEEKYVLTSKKKTIAKPKIEKKIEANVTVDTEEKKEEVKVENEPKPVVKKTAIKKTTTKKKEVKEVDK